MTDNLGDRFVATRLVPEGWAVLFPWILTPEGHRWRPHWEVALFGSEEQRQAMAEHYAAELNRVMEAIGRGSGTDLYTAQEALVDAAEYLERAGAMGWWCEKYAAAVWAAWKAVRR